MKKSGDNDQDAELDIGGAFLQPQGVIQNLRATIQGNEILKEAIKDIGGNLGQARELLKNSKGQSSQLSIPINIQSGSLSENISSRFRAGIQSSLSKFSSSFAKENIPNIKFNGGKFRKAFQISNREQIEGGIFESFINGLSDKPFDNQKINPNDVFDFRQGLGAASEAFNLPGNLIADAKRTFNTDALASLTKKGGNAIIESISADLAAQLIQSGAKGSTKEKEARQKAVKRNSGGGISGSDTVPAMLTPGEFVFNKSAAKSIGYSNLSRMNKHGVKGYAAGGVVTQGRNFYGDNFSFRGDEIPFISSRVNPSSASDIKKQLAAIIAEQAEQAQQLDNDFVSAFSSSELGAMKGGAT